MIQSKPVPKDTLPKCGIIMPISAIDGYPAEHWTDILNILKDVIKSINFEPNLVSDADDSGIIQKRIIQNIYDNEIIVCDVSCKNPNVMFELGMRLAFDKPTIIIKDDTTNYSFDTSIIEHLTYPRDLRFNKILEFKESLKKKIDATFKKAKSDPNYSTFLKNFGQYKIAHLHQKEVSSDEFILNTLADIKSEINQIKKTTNINFKSEAVLQVERNTLINKINIINPFVIEYCRTHKIDMSNISKHVEEITAYILQLKSMGRIFQDDISELKKAILALEHPF